MSTVIHLSLSNDSETARQTVGNKYQLTMIKFVLTKILTKQTGGLANLAEDIETHEYIAKAGGGKCLIALQKHKSLDIQVLLTQHKYKHLFNHTKVSYM